MRMLLLAAAAWVIYRIAQENTDEQAPAALLTSSKVRLKRKIKRAAS